MEVSDVVDKLEALGSAEQIRLFFQAEGIVGVRNARMDCPVSRYITRETGKTVLVDDVDIYDGTYTPTPNAIGDFVVIFDTGAYAELIG